MKRTISEAGDFGDLELNYCTTVHKSQGSEWRKVWLILHRSHATMLNRELLYTGMTRAAEKLTVLYSRIPGPIRDNSTINKAIQRAKLDGLSWQDKAEYFLSKRAQKRAEEKETSVEIE